MNNASKIYLKILKVVSIIYIIIPLLFIISACGGLFMVIGIDAIQPVLDWLEDLYQKSIINNYVYSFFDSVVVIFKLVNVFMTLLVEFIMTFFTVFSVFNPYSLANTIYHGPDSDINLITLILLNLFMIFLCVVTCLCSFYMYKTIKRESEKSEPLGKILFLTNISFILPLILVHIIGDFNYLFFLYSFDNILK